MKRRIFFTLLASAGLLAACATVGDELVTEGYVQMSGAEIRTALVGNSLDGTDSDGDYVIYYPSSSMMRIVYQGRTEAGVWRIRGDKYCRRWQTFGSGNERCVTMYRKGNQIDWVQDNEITDRSVLVAGNPARL
ncbi:hypothetical protein [Yoonia sp.]|uniref:hypothetical protein n=1 Tax=Yoonia sp. TaxID=2212373 RepID=UPI003F6D9320